MCSIPVQGTDCVYCPNGQDRLNSRMTPAHSTFLAQRKGFARSRERDFQTSRNVRLRETPDRAGRRLVTAEVLKHVVEFARARVQRRRPACHHHVGAVIHRSPPSRAMGWWPPVLQSHTFAKPPANLLVHSSRCGLCIRVLYYSTLNQKWQHCLCRVVHWTPNRSRKVCRIIYSWLTKICVLI